MVTAFKNKVVDLISNRRRTAIVLFVFLIVGGVFLAAGPAMALDALAQLLSWIMNFIVQVMGKLILLLVGILVGWLAPYNGFDTSTAITTGWVLTRDIANMFFILVLLAIAFGTILKIEQLNYQKVLPKLLIMAVLINFSKTLCLLMIDFGQVVMLTFVNAFMAAAGGNFLNAFGLTNLLQISMASNAPIGSWDVAGAYFFAMIMLGIALMVVVVYIIVLAYRIVILWILVILSPLAFLAGGFPVGKASAAYSQWWDNFIGAVIVGPILAFFLWLALLTAGSGTLGATFENPAYTQPEGEAAIAGGLTAAEGQQFFISEGASSQAITGFIIAAAMLLAGLAVAQQSGGMIGGQVGNIAGRTKGFMGGALKRTAVGAARIGRATAGAADRTFRGRERLYGAVGKMGIPLVSGAAMGRMASARQERQKRTADIAAQTKNLRADELERIVASPAYTERDRALKAGAVEQLVKAKARTGGLEANLDARRYLSEWEKSASPEEMERVSEFKEKNPHAIADAGERAQAFRSMDLKGLQGASGEAKKQVEFFSELARREKEQGLDINKNFSGAVVTDFNAFKKEFGDGPYPDQGRFDADKGFQGMRAPGATPEALQQASRAAALGTMAQERDAAIAKPDAVVYSAATATRVYADDIRENMEEQQRRGATPLQAWSYDDVSGRFDAKPNVNPEAMKNTFEQAIFEAGTAVQSEATAPPERNNAVEFISNINVDAVGKAGDYQDAVIKNLDGASLADAWAAATSGTTEQASIEKVVGAVTQAINEQMKGLDTASDKYKELNRKLDEIKANPVLSRFTTKT